MKLFGYWSLFCVIYHFFVFFCGGSPPAILKGIAMFFPGQCDGAVVSRNLEFTFEVQYASS